MWMRRLVGQTHFLCFQAAVFAQDIDIALSASRRLAARANCALTLGLIDFCGGPRDSGMGTGGIPYSIPELYPEKLIVLAENSRVKVFALLLSCSGFSSSSML